jgi:acetylglutamate kinase
VLVAGAAVPSLSHDDARALVAAGTAAGGMAAKLEAGYDALARGVARVRIGDLEALTNPSSGTTLLPPTTVPWPR